MPVRAPMLCGCGRVVQGGPCLACAAARAKAYDARRPTARQRGYDSAWNKARATFLTAHPRCAMCEQPAAVVDHIKPHRGDRKLFWERSNWQPLCQHHHSSTKQRMERADV
ncbi:MAG: HNH endonuclease [Brevundimonas sp.]|nr:HNH endonuclease [Brevundimonas sp.]